LRRSDSGAAREMTWENGCALTPVHGWMGSPRSERWYTLSYAVKLVTKNVNFSTHFLVVEFEL
jgi:hypothetical protein